MSRSVLFPVVLLFASCGGGSEHFCKKWADQFEACDGEEVDTTECEAQTATCSSEDLDLLDDFYTCADDAGLFTCDTESPTTSLTDALENIGAIFACTEPLSGLSEECQGVMQTTGSTSAFL